MHARRHGRPALALIVMLTALAPLAEAQRAAGPYAGLLGTTTDENATHLLSVRGSLFGSWDDTLTSSDDAALDRRFLRSGAAAGASGSLTHARRSSRFQWSSSAGSSLRLYGTDSDARAGTFNAQTGISTSLSRRVSLSASSAWSYSPYYDFAPGLDTRLSNVGAHGGGFNVATAAERHTDTSIGAGIGFQMSRRDTVSFSGNARRSQFLDQPDSQIDFWDVGGRWAHTLTRSLGFHAGFTRQDASYRFSGSTPATTDNFDIGVDYHDALVFTLSRRTSLSFATSTSAVHWNDQTHFRLNGSAALTRSFGRSGSAVLSYTRDTDFNAGFRAPLLRDSVSAGVSNQLSPRATWSIRAGYHRGNIGFGSSGGSFDSTSAGGSVQVAMTRGLGLFTDYSIYRYDVPTGSTVFTSLSRFTRQSVTAGLSIWVPLIAETRSK